MRKRWNSLAVILCVSLFVTGCSEQAQNTGNDSNTATNKTEVQTNEKQSNLDVLQPMAYGNVQGLTLEKGTSISIIGRGSSSAYWTEIKAGAQRAIDDMNSMLGYKGDDKVKLTYSAPAMEDDVDDQVNILDEELARYPSAIGIAAVDSEACEVQFDLAAENGIPVVAFDSGTDYQDIVCMIDTNNMEAAAMAANKLCDMIDNEGEVIAVMHDNKSTSAKEREEGFQNTIQQKHSNVQVVEKYHLDDLEDLQKQIELEQKEEDKTEDNGSSEPEKDGEDSDTPDVDEAAASMTQEDAVKYILEKHPDVKGIYTTNETTAKLVLSVLEELDGNDVKVVSFDGGKEQLERLE